MEYALLVGPAMNERRGCFLDAFRWRAPVLSCESSNSAQILAFLACSRVRIGALGSSHADLWETQSLCHLAWRKLPGARRPSVQIFPDRPMSGKLTGKLRWVPLKFYLELSLQSNAISHLNPRALRVRTLQRFELLASLNCARQGTQKRGRAIPHDLHANANQEKRGKP